MKNDYHDYATRHQTNFPFIKHIHMVVSYVMTGYPQSSFRTMGFSLGFSLQKSFIFCTPISGNPHIDIHIQNSADTTLPCSSTKSPLSDDSFLRPGAFSAPQQSPGDAAKWRVHCGATSAGSREAGLGPATDKPQRGLIASVCNWWVTGE